MLNFNDLHEYQKNTVEFINENPYCGLFLDLGLGKTVTALTAINDLMYDRFEVSKVLVIAPLRVADTTWSAEADKWGHLKHLTISKILGDKKSRIRALRKKADIYVINVENVSWLVAYLGSAFNFDMVVIDELSCFKDHESIRFKALRQVRPSVKRVVGLTGTPAPNGLIQLWPQLYLLDRGARLGRTITEYRNNYFLPGKTNGHVVFNYKLRDKSENAIYEKISDICISMKACDYINMPRRIDNKIEIAFDETVGKQYRDFERQQVLKLKSDEEITVVNAAALCNKLLQFANGAVYNEDKVYKETHDLKIKALEEILETSGGKNVLVFYSYQHDLDRIQKKLKKYHPQALKTSEDISDWNAGKIELLLAHPKSAGHGLNLQSGGNIIVWFGLTWSLELYQQANARLYRQGQTETVVIHHLVVKGSMDEDVMQALEGKAAGQNALLDAVKARIGKYRLEIN